METLEESKNIIIQVLSEFSAFLYAISHDKKDNIDLHNIIVDSTCLHMRVLIEFFQTTKKDSDDLLYKDLIDSVEDLSFTKNKALSTYLNKQTMHLSKERGNVSIPVDDFKNAIVCLVDLIKRYITALDTSIKLCYYADYHEKDAQELRDKIQFELLDFYLRNSSYVRT